MIPGQQEKEEPLMISLELKIRMMSFSMSLPSQSRRTVSAISSPISSRGRLMQVTDGFEKLQSGVSSKLTIVSFCDFLTLLTFPEKDFILYK